MLEDVNEKHKNSFLRKRSVVVHPHGPPSLSLTLELWRTSLRNIWRNTLAAPAVATAPAVAKAGPPSLSLTLELWRTSLRNIWRNTLAAPAVATAPAVAKAGPPSLSLTLELWRTSLRNIWRNTLAAPAVATAPAVAKAGRGSQARLEPSCYPKVGLDHPEGDRCLRTP